MNKTPRFAFWLMVVLCAGSVLCHNCFADPKPGGDMKVLYWQFPPHFNSAIKSGGAVAAPAANIFVSLVEMNDKWEPVPYLAKSWTISDDGLTYTFKLVEGTVFHDDKPVTAKDVAFSVEAMKEYHPFGPYMFGAVDRVETPDTFTAVVKLKQPHPALLAALSSPFTPVLPSHIYSLDDLDMSAHNIKAIGSGPFKVVEYKANQYFILERFDRFLRPGRPYINRYIGNKITNPKAAFMAMSGGEAHVLGFMAVPQMIEGFKKKEFVWNEETKLGKVTKIEFPDTWDW